MSRPRTASGFERFVVATGTWLVVGAVAACFAPWPVAVLAGWDAGAAALIAWVWVSVGRFTPAQTRQVATREDNSRVATSLFLLTASVASLGGAGFAIVTANDARPGERTALLVLGVLTVVLSWGVVQTMFALRYAHEYYTPPVGGIDFNDDGHFNDDGADPDYQDFAYLAVTVGMTFQVSDTSIRARRIRRTVSRHALLAYLFGAVILAVMVNVIAGLVG